MAKMQKTWTRLLLFSLLSILTHHLTYADFKGANHLKIDVGNDPISERDFSPSDSDLNQFVLPKLGVNERVVREVALDGRNEAEEFKSVAEPERAQGHRRIRRAKHRGHSRGLHVLYHNHGAMAGRRSLADTIADGEKSFEVEAGHNPRDKAVTSNVTNGPKLGDEILGQGIKGAKDGADHHGHRHKRGRHRGHHHEKHHHGGHEGGHKGRHREGHKQRHEGGHEGKHDGGNKEGH